MPFLRQGKEAGSGKNANREVGVPRKRKMRAPAEMLFGGAGWWKRSGRASCAGWSENWIGAGHSSEELAIHGYERRASERAVLRNGEREGSRTVS